MQVMNTVPPTKCPTKIPALTKLNTSKNHLNANMDHIKPFLYQDKPTYFEVNGAKNEKGSKIKLDGKVIDLDLIAKIKQQNVGNIVSFAASKEFISNLTGNKLSSNNFSLVNQSKYGQEHQVIRYPNPVKNTSCKLQSDQVALPKLPYVNDQRFLNSSHLEVKKFAPEMNGLLTGLSTALKPNSLPISQSKSRITNSAPLKIEKLSNVYQSAKATAKNFNQAKNSLLSAVKASQVASDKDKRKNNNYFSMEKVKTTQYEQLSSSSEHMKKQIKTQAQPYRLPEFASNKNFSSENKSKPFDEFPKHRNGTQEYFHRSSSPFRHKDFKHFKSQSLQPAKTSPPPLYKDVTPSICESSRNLISKKNFESKNKQEVTNKGSFKSRNKEVTPYNIQNIINEYNNAKTQTKNHIVSKNNFLHFQPPHEKMSSPKETLRIKGFSELYETAAKNVLKIQVFPDEKGEESPKSPKIEKELDEYLKFSRSKEKPNMKLSTLAKTVESKIHYPENENQRNTMLEPKSNLYKNILSETKPNLEKHLQNKTVNNFDQIPDQPKILPNITTNICNSTSNNNVFTFTKLIDSSEPTEKKQFNEMNINEKKISLSFPRIPAPQIVPHFPPPPYYLPHADFPWLYPPYFYKPYPPLLNLNCYYGDPYYGVSTSIQTNKNQEPTKTITEHRDSPKEIDNENTISTEITLFEKQLDDDIPFKIKSEPCDEETENKAFVVEEEVKKINKFKERPSVIAQIEKIGSRRNANPVDKKIKKDLKYRPYRLRERIKTSKQSTHKGETPEKPKYLLKELNVYSTRKEIFLGELNLRRILKRIETSTSETGYI